MAVTDAKPVVQKGVAYRHYFAIRDTAGALVTTWAGQDSELSKDNGAFADATYEATEITGTGIGYIDLTDLETDYDIIILKVTVTNTDALDYVCAIYPEEAGDIRVDLTQMTGGDIDAVDNLKSTYNGAGYIDDNAPATQGQVSGLGAVGGSLNEIADLFENTSTSPIASGSCASTFAEDQVYHQIQDNSGTIDVYYEFDIGSTGKASNATVIGRLNGGNDDLIMYAWNWTGTPAWDVIRSYDGQVSSGDVTRTAILTTAHTGTGSNLGKVRIRFAGTGLTSANLYIDQISMAYSVVQSATGYANGMVWVNSVTGTAGIIPHINGTADNPVASLADALTIGGLVGLNRYNVSTGSVVEVPSAQSNISLEGFNYHLTPAGYALNDCTVDGAIVTGTIADSEGELTFWRCLFGNCSIPSSNQLYCGYGNTMTLSTDGGYIFNDAFSAVAGGGAPIFDCGALGSQQLNFRHVSMGVDLRNFGANGTDTMSLEGNGQLILNQNCESGGTVHIRGNFQVTDNSDDTGTAVNIVDDANFYDTKGDIAAVKEDTALIVEDTHEIQSKLPTNKFMGSSDGADDDATLDDILEDTGTTLENRQVEILADVTGLAGNAMVGTDNAALASVCTEARLAELDPANLPTDVAAIPTVMIGTDNAALASVCTEARLAELDPANLPTDVAAIPAEVLAGTIEGTLTLQQALSVLVALAAGECDGGETTTIHYRNQADTVNRITLTVDTVGDRSASVIDVTDL